MMSNFHARLRTESLRSIRAIIAGCDTGKHCVSPCKTKGKHQTYSEKKIRNCGSYNGINYIHFCIYIVHCVINCVLVSSTMGMKLRRLQLYDYYDDSRCYAVWKIVAIKVKEIKLTEMKRQGEDIGNGNSLQSQPGFFLWQIIAPSPELRDTFISTYLFRFLTEKTIVGGNSFFPNQAT